LASSRYQIEPHPAFKGHKCSVSADQQIEMKADSRCVATLLVLIRENVCLCSLLEPRLDPKRTLFLPGYKVKVGGHLTAHSSANLDTLIRTGPNAGVITRDQPA
jgi:hypothetical protein